MSAQPVAALLRGINVGGRSMVSMAALRSILEGFGFEGVRTYLQSGNAVFRTRDSPSRTAAAVEAALLRELKMPIQVLVRTRDELADVVERNPLRELADDPARYVVLFLSAAPKAATLAAIDAEAFAPDVFEASGREIFVWFPRGMGRSRLMTALSDKRLGVVTTARNWRTVTALLRMADEA